MFCFQTNAWQEINNLLFLLFCLLKNKYKSVEKYIHFRPEEHALREILLVMLTKSSQLFIFSKQYQKFCKTYQCSKVYGTKYATIFFLL